MLSESALASQAQNILRRISKVDFQQDQASVESQIKQKIEEGDKLSTAQARVLQVQSAMQANVKKIVENTTDVDVKQIDLFNLFFREWKPPV